MPRHDALAREDPRTLHRTLYVCRAPRSPGKFYMESTSRLLCDTGGREADALALHS